MIRYVTIERIDKDGCKVIVQYENDNRSLAQVLGDIQRIRANLAGTAATVTSSSSDPGSSPSSR